MKKQSTWFSHDATASHDPKLIALTATHGMTGYGRWWRLVEILRAEQGYKYNITTPFAYTVLAKELMCSTNEAQQFIQDCITQYQLLHTDDEYIWSASLCGRMEHLDTKKQTLSERGKKGAAATNAKKSAQAQTSDGTSTPNKTKQKETKQNKSSPLEGGGGGCQLIENPKAEANWQKQKTAALADTSFTYAIISTGKVTQAQLQQWLTTFNRILAFRGEAPKSAQEYRKHFINWFKFRDPAKEDPETFLVPEARNKAPVLIPTNTFLKTPQQVEEEQKQRKGRMAQ